ncbi:MAG: DNA mismatch repair protein MutS [Clostridiales bacterium]|nr:DNA mismatch repair protein MutS [Clostridiales bacterium]
MAKKVVETPLMKQYFEMKRKHPDAVLLFRVGDFYETFSDDAISASEILGITLTRRANGSASSVELAGFPHHALDTYLPRLVRAGKRVAICEQLEDPKTVKGLVKRGITELVTPGVSINDNCLDNRENNFLASIHWGKRDTAGVAFLDISTGEFLVAEGTIDYIDKLIANYAPKELLVESGKRDIATTRLSGKYLVTTLDDWIFTPGAASDRLLKQFGTGTLKGFGVDNMPLAIIAAGAVMHYLDITEHTMTGHITGLRRIEADRYVRLDAFTVRNLELLGSNSPDGMSLLDVLDRTISPMGARMFKTWLRFPLLSVDDINRRLDMVEYFFKHPDERDALRQHLTGMGDLERLISKVSQQRVSPRELIQLRNALQALVPIKDICATANCEPLQQLAAAIDPCTTIADRITHDIVQDAPIALNRGTVINNGVDEELDSLREIAFHGKEYLNGIVQREIAATGISSLKIGFNNVFGYYIEVTNTHKDKVPPEWIRKQTLVNAERYITEELKEYETKILGAQERMEVIETRLFNALVATVGEQVTAIQADARAVACIDCVLSLTTTAIENHYNRPVVDDSLTLDIVDGRHPVIEKRLDPGNEYIANSVHLDNDGTQVMMITGPNMSGKSALLRSTALNVLMAQMGSFVAARNAHIGIVDKIFTRVGASDNISQGESTFMVEMTEAASILNNMSERSLILFDELGRGTSTYDGISIAWAIVEHIHQSRQRPKTLFATHYHELNEMETKFNRVVNFNVSVKEINGKVVFLRKLAKGGSEHSFGIHVARLAGMPSSIVKRADEVLRHLEENARRDGDHGCIDVPSSRDMAAIDAPDGMQLSFFQLDDPILAQVRDHLLELDINNLTPMDALNKLNDIRSILTGK